MSQRLFKGKNMLTRKEEDLFIVITLKNNSCVKKWTPISLKIQVIDNQHLSEEKQYTNASNNNNNQLTKLVADENLHPTKIPLERRIDLEQLCKVQRANMK